MARVYVCFWFDVEDYVTPQSDDALLRLAHIFSDQGVSATFKLVGEKARRLRSRGRQDVIAAVRLHDIGYHTDLHSVHPTVSEYLEGLGWEEGIAEFDRRERPGLGDVEEIFGKRCSTYGQPGGSWAPHVYPALRQWGVPTYVDEASHLGLNDQPFWYCGVLNALRLRSRFTRLSLVAGDGLARACADFDRIATELAAEGGGLISICHHECEWATTSFWDGVNFARGRNAPLEALMAPPLKSPQESERHFADFAAYLGHIVGSGAALVTAADLPGLFPDQWNAAPLRPDGIFALADALADGVNYHPVPYGWASAAEAFGVVLGALCTRLDTGRLAYPVPGRYLEGPTARARGAVSCEVCRADFTAACRAVREEMAQTAHIPAQVTLADHVVSPAAFARAAARFLLQEVAGGAPAVISVHDAPLECESEVVEEGAFGWVIFPPGFRAPRLMELARLQTWTLKPAML